MTVKKRPRGRPPKNQAGYNDTKKAILNAGLAALTEKGFAATGIDEILRKVNVPKGSFYHYFKNKEAFGAELIERYAQFFNAKLDRLFLNTERTPKQRLYDFVDDAESGMSKYDFNRGCLIGNLGQEISAIPTAYQTQLIDVFVGWQKKTADCLQAGIEAGEISPELDCDNAAEFFWIGWEGAVLRAKLEKSADPLHRFAKAFIAGIEVK